MFRDFEHGAWEDAEVHLWHKADVGIRRHQVCF